MQDTTATLPLRQEFGIRLGAWAIDFFSFLIIASILQQVYILSVGLNQLEIQPEEFIGLGPFEIMEQMLLKYRFLGLFSTLVVVGWYGTEVFTGQTIGKMALGLKVGSLDGSPASKSTLLNRFLLKHSGLLITYAFGYLSGSILLVFLGGLLNFIVGIGCFFVLGDGRQALHDRLTRTAVFKKKQMLPAGTIATPLSY